MKKAAEYKINFEQLMNGTAASNAAYHLQFVEWCFEKKKTEKSTTLSLLRRTIIVELVSIVELLLYEALKKLKVSNTSDTIHTSNYVPEYFTLGKLREIAEHHEMINKSLGKKIETVGEHRNCIHFKKLTKDYILEYNYYTDAMVDEAKNVLTEVLAKLHQLENHRCKFIFPWR